MFDFLLGLFGNVLAAEIGAWCRVLAHKIICVTALKLPAKIQSRMLEEWGALLEDIPGDISKLWMAISLYRKRSALVDECEELVDKPILPPVGKVLRFTKRFVDIQVSIIGLLMLLPLFLLVSVLIKIDSPGPVIYRQVRVGLRGRPFLIWKFRTIRQDAEKACSSWTLMSDPRISRIGWWLRKTCIDEIPQLLNVLKGDMSLIGPRPERQDFSQYMQDNIPYYGLRHTVRPGLTGWAQVEFPCSATADDAFMKFQYDLYYVKRLSFWIDMSVLAKTIQAVLLGKRLV